MKIKVDAEHKEKLQAAIDAAQSKAKVRTITADDIIYAVEEIERYLAIPKNHMVGIKASCDPHAQLYPGAYQYTPDSTQFTIERFPSGWFVTSISRWRTGGTKKQFCLSLTEDAEKALIERFKWF